MLIKCDRYFFETCSATSLTFVDDSEEDLSIAAVHIWTVAHLADVGAIKGRRHIEQGDGNVPFHNISRPHRVPFKTPQHGRVWYVLVVKDLTQTHTQSSNIAKSRSPNKLASMRKTTGSYLLLLTCAAQDIFSDCFRELLKEGKYIE